MMQCHLSSLHLNSSEICIKRDNSVRPAYDWRTHCGLRTATPGVMGGSEHTSSSLVHISTDKNKGINSNPLFFPFIFLVMEKKYAGIVCVMVLPVIIEIMIYFIVMFKI